MKYDYYGYYGGFNGVESRNGNINATKGIYKLASTLNEPPGLLWEPSMYNKSCPYRVAHIENYKR